MKKTGKRLCSLTLALTLCLGFCISVSAKQAAIQYNTEPTSIGGISQLKEKYSSLYVGEDSSAWASAWLRDKAGNTLSAGSLGVDVTSLIALVSVFGLAVSLAVQDVLSNVAGGMVLLLS